MLRALGSVPRFLFHFLTILLQERKNMLKDYVSFFNKLSAKKKNYARDLYFIF
jgi:hypothetical protein